MKFVVDRRIERKNYLELICELPTNIIFLSISFSLVSIFMNDIIKKEDVFSFIVFVIVSLIVVTIFKECKYLIDASKTKKGIITLVILIFLNYPISLGCLYFASDQLLKEKKTIPTEQLFESKKIYICR